MPPSKAERYVELCLHMHDPVLKPTAGTAHEDFIVREQDRLWCAMTPEERTEAEPLCLAAAAEQERMLEELSR